MRTLHGPCAKSPGRADRRMPEWACCRVASLSRCRVQAMPRTAAHSAPKEGLCTANSSRDGAEGRPTRMRGHAWWTAARTSVKCGTPVSATHRRRRRRRHRLRRPTQRMIIAKVRLAALRIRIRFHACLHMWCIKAVLRAQSTAVQSCMARRTTGAGATCAYGRMIARLQMAVCHWTQPASRQPPLRPKASLVPVHFPRTR